MLKVASYHSVMSNNNVLDKTRWAFNVKSWKPTASEWEQASRCIQEEERRRIRRFHFKDDAKSAMIGRLLMRKAANEMTGIPYDKICFSRTENGKPYLSDYSDFLQEVNFSFNISHHGDFCVIAAEPHNIRLGIDIMKIEYRGTKTLSDYFNLMKKQFSYSEFEYMTSPGSEKQQLERFYRLWCLKESYVKAEGTGISRNLKDIDFVCCTLDLCPNMVITDTILTVDGRRADEWRFEEMLINSTHCVAVAIDKNAAVSKGENSPKFMQLDYDKLMRNAKTLGDCDENEWIDFYNKPEKPN